MGNHVSCDGEITVEAWGGAGGKDWSYKAKHGIKQIIIIHGDIIDSIMFKGAIEHPLAADNSIKFGGAGGNRTLKVDIDFPSEFLTGISGTYNTNAISSLKFQTNQTQYGPFGTEMGNPFSFQGERGVITGFHGRAGQFLGAIGVYLKPACSIFTVLLMKEHSEMELRCLRGDLPRSPGPWGNVNGGGRVWDDGVFAAVKQAQVHVHSKKGLISGVRFGYEKRDGEALLSPLHGDPPKEIVKKIEIDGKNEYLIGVEGFYGPVEGIVGLNVITSLTFLTNKGKYGPLGTEIGTYFTSMSSSMPTNGKVVGFHGRSGAYLDAIGVHTEY